MISFAHMLVLVPAPPCSTPSTNWSCSWPSMISWHTWSMRSARWGRITPISLFARAAACFTIASAITRFGWFDSARRVMGKFSRARAVWMPQ